jgi:hypothetical protein
MVGVTAPEIPVEAPAAVPDEQLAAAIDVARAAAAEVGGTSVGEHLAVHAESEYVVSHAFASTVPGYAGWMWIVTLARTAGQDEATVDEVVLLPGPDALLAPVWVPWHDRVRPGDLGPGDLLPGREDDPRLVPAYLQSDDIAPTELADQPGPTGTDELSVERLADETLGESASAEQPSRPAAAPVDDPTFISVAFELGLGREQVLSRDGRMLAAERWYDGEFGPSAAMARHAPDTCGTCGFLVPLAGSLQAGFGACGNEFAPADGRVVSVEYGCGAHSGVRAEPTPLGEHGGPVYDDGDLPL